MRTPAQYAADRRRSHKASAKREQKNAARLHAWAQRWPGHFLDSRATTARMARMHLNFLLCGEYKDFE